MPCAICHCKSEGEIESSYDLTAEYKKEDFFDYENLENFPTGDLIACKNCQTKYFKYKVYSRIFLLQITDEKIFYDWAHGVYCVSEEQENILENIGAKYKYRSYSPDLYVDIPCRIETVQGEIYDPAYVRFGCVPPTAENKHRYLNEVKEITPSKYVLPDEIRVYSSRHQHFGSWDAYFPSTCVGNSEFSYYYDYDADYLLINNVPVKDFKLNGGSEDHQKSYKKPRNSPPVKYFYGSWKDKYNFFYIEPYLLFYAETEYIKLNFRPKLQDYINVFKLYEMYYGSRGQSSKPKEIRFLLSIKNLETIISEIKNANLKPVELNYNGMSFIESQKEISNFNSIKNIGIIKIKPGLSEQKISQIEVHCLVIANNLPEGLYIFLDFPESWINWYNHSSYNFLDWDAHG